MLLAQLLVALFSLIWAAIIIKANKYSTKKIDDPTNKTIYLIPIFSIIFILTVFRAASTGYDYQAYLDISNALNSVSFFDMWDLPGVNMEPLLMIVLRLCILIKADLIPFLFISTLSIIFIYYKAIKSDSKIVWLSVMLLFCFGSYFTVFNTISQFFVCALAFAASKYIYEGKFVKYLILILFIALIHKTVLFMIPMYFILRYIPNKKISRRVALIGLFVVVAMMSTIFDQIILIGTNTFFPEYAGVTGLPSAPSLTVLRPLVIVIFIMLTKKYLDLDNMKERVWFNAAIYSLIIAIFSLKFGLMQRFTYFLIPYLILLIPNIIAKIPTRGHRHLYLFILVIIMLAYVILTNSVSNLDYTFIWQKVVT